ncbi:RPM1-interacting protein 4 [Citrus sinensis]|nr:RPM1-interacting protein 4 [Citrus sinensis]
MYFDKARKGRTGGTMINPNDPQENPDLLSDYEAQAPAPPSKIKAEPEKPLGQEAVRTTYERWRNKEGSDLRQSRDSPARHDDMSCRAATESAHQRGGRVASSGETYKKPVRNSIGSDNSFERSPMHNQARNPRRGSLDSSSPSWEGKSVYTNSHGTPGRSRMRPNPRVDESPDGGAAFPKFSDWDQNTASADGYNHIFKKLRDERRIGSSWSFAENVALRTTPDLEVPDKGAAVPKFGDWDENNPSSADGYTHIFNQVREERNSAGRAGMQSPSTQRNYHRPTNNDGVKSCCFPWGKK